MASHLLNRRTQLPSHNRATHSTAVFLLQADLREAQEILQQLNTLASDDPPTTGGSGGGADATAEEEGSEEASEVGQ